LPGAHSQSAQGTNLKKKETRKYKTKWKNRKKKKKKKKKNEESNEESTSEPSSMEGINMPAGIRVPNATAVHANTMAAQAARCHAASPGAFKLQTSNS
jgi:hypothetical protein